MRLGFFSTLALLLLASPWARGAPRTAGLDAIHSGVAWHDQNGNVVSARGAGIVKEGDRYFLFGEFKRDHGNEFAGFSCYSSPDLINWTFEAIALPPQKEGRLGPARVGERPKVMKCPKTGEFVMFMHTDDARYKDPAVGYATSATITGPYTFQGPLLFNGGVIKKWDMGVFQDDDDAGYLIIHSGGLYRLSDDYKSAAEHIVKGIAHGFESPAIFKRDGTYYWLGSHLTAWERNDNSYLTAKSLAGPWEARGHFAPEGSLTWNSQTTFVLPVVGSETTTYLFMGDRWAHPRQNSAATYVWQPLRFDAAGRMSLPEFHPSWTVDTRTGRWSPAMLEGRLVDIRAREGLSHTEDWKPHTDAAARSDLRSDVKGGTLTIPFTGTQIGLFGVARSDGGFGQVQLKDAKGEVVLTTIIETYCLYDEASLKFLSPKLPRGDYTLAVTVLGERFFWQAKTTTYGSRGDFVSVQKVLLVD
jgi:hypothetical protein